MIMAIVKNIYIIIFFIEIIFDKHMYSYYSKLMLYLFFYNHRISNTMLVVWSQCQCPCFYLGHILYACPQPWSVGRSNIIINIILWLRAEPTWPFLYYQSVQVNDTFFLTIKFYMWEVNKHKSTKLLCKLGCSCGG